MALDEDPAVRTDSLPFILGCRLQDHSDDSKKIGKLNFAAENWTDLVVMTDLSSSDEPSSTRHFSCEYLEGTLASAIEIDLPKLPAHSQSVERSVKLVSKSSNLVYGEDSRHALVKSMTLSHLLRPDGNSRKFYANE